MATLFISDLHLSEQRPNIVALFLKFLGSEAREAEALYILGDLFEYWIGDEVGSLPQVKPVLDGLRGLTDSGVPVYIMHGNRDFLLGEQFASATGCQLINDPVVIKLNDENVLLMHGDTLCTDDKDYIKFRAFVRNPVWQADFLGKSIDERIAIANNYREMSKTAMNDKPAEIMDTNQETVEDTMKEHGVQTLIHGHTHRPNKHEFELAGKQVTRFVLGDWYEQGSMLVCNEQGCSLKDLR
ncbi:MAG: UDP-2,3-diacylglucosamine diphosphatase [Acidiferrobacterales bacterium]